MKYPQKWSLFHKMRLKFDILILKILLQLLFLGHVVQLEVTCQKNIDNNNNVQKETEGKNLPKFPLIQTFVNRY